MARKAKKRRVAGEPAALQMTPMIDVVFQLLIYFVVTIRPMDIAAHLDVFKPSSDQPPPDSVEPPKMIQIQIFQGALIMNERSVTLDSMTEILEKLAAIKKSQTVVIMCALDSEHDTLINVLEHVDDPALVLKKAKGWMAPDGVIIIHVPNAHGLNRHLGREMGLIKTLYDLAESDIEVGHKRFYDDTRLLKDIEEGIDLFADVRWGGVFLKPFSNAQMQRIADEWDNAMQIFDGLYQLARELPEYSSPIWAVCKG